MQSRPSIDVDGSPHDFPPVADQASFHTLSFQQSLQPSLQQSLSIEPAATADSNASNKLSRHHRRNSTVQEQRAAKLKQQETRRMLSLSKVTIRSGRYLHVL